MKKLILLILCLMLTACGSFMPRITGLTPGQVRGNSNDAFWEQMDIDPSYYDDQGEPVRKVWRTPYKRMEDIQVGHLIGYDRPELSGKDGGVAHFVVEVHPDGVVTRGASNPSNDRRFVHEEQIRYRILARDPESGKPIWNTSYFFDD